MTDEERGSTGMPAAEFEIKRLQNALADALAREAEAHTLFDLCWNAIRTAIADDDGLDGAIGETLMKEIRQLQEALAAPAPGPCPECGTRNDVHAVWCQPLPSGGKEPATSEAERRVTSIPGEPGLVAVPKSLWYEAQKALAHQQGERK